MVHSDSDLILHNSSVLIDKEPKKRRAVAFAAALLLYFLLFSIISCTSFPNNDYFDVSRIIQFFFDSFTNITY
ncbi:hypothetical protein EXW18_07320 [Enterococcus faecium]|nr:hypothetical protein [Enterococcus faecium]